MVQCRWGGGAERETHLEQKTEQHIQKQKTDLQAFVYVYIRSGTTTRFITFQVRLCCGFLHVGAWCV